MRAGARAKIAIGAAALLGALLIAPAAQAKVAYLFKEDFGSASQPSFTEPGAMTVDPATGDLLVVDNGANEQQKIAFSGFANGDKLTLTWTSPGGSPETTAEIAYSSSDFTRAKLVREALEAKFGAGDFSVNAFSEFKNPNSSATVTFSGAYGGEPVSLLSCAVVSGSGSCSVERTRAGVESGLFRFKSNGEADDFSALSANVIDGKGGADQTPQERLIFGSNSRSTQIAVDRSCSLHEPPLAGGECESFDPADGDIYVTQAKGSLVDVFSEAGEYLGQIAESTSNEVQQVELSGFAEGDEFTLSDLPASCAESHTAQLPYSTSVGEEIREALAAQCGPDFAVATSLSVNVEFTGALGHKNLNEIGCNTLHGGTCSVDTTTQGDATHNEVKKVELRGLSAGSSFSFFSLRELGEACSNFSESIPYAADAAVVADGVQAALEEQCGPNFSVTPGAFRATVTFSNSLGIADQPQLACAVDSGAGACSGTTTRDGGQAKPFGSVDGVAVDSSGAVYVADAKNSIVHGYLLVSNSPYAATSTANLYREGAVGLVAGAGPAAGYLFANGGGGPVKLDSATGEQKYVVAPASTFALALDSADGTLLGASESEAALYDVSGSTEATLLASLHPAGGQIAGLAVDASGEAYLSRRGNPEIAVYELVPLPEAQTEAATSIGGEEATLHGELSAEGGPAASCQFQYVTEAEFGKQGFKQAQSAPCSPPGPFTGSGLEAVSATVAGLASGTDYRFRVVATSAAGSTPEGSEGSLHFKTLGPAIAEEEASEIGETEATVSGQVNPNGEATSFAVQYVTEAEYLKSGYNNATTEPVPPEAVGSGTELVAVSHRLAGLATATAYRYRIVATTPSATGHGTDRRFATYPAATGLPDRRAYEMVSPSAKTGEVIPPNASLGGSCSECLPGLNVYTQPMQAAPDGESVLYEGQPFAEGLASGADSYLSGRDPGAGWDWQGISSPLMTDGRWLAFNADLRRGIFAQASPTLSPRAPSRGGFGFANLYLWEAGAMEPLIETEPPHRDPAGSDFFQVRYAGADAGFEHVAFEADDALTPEVEGIAPEAPETAPPPVSGGSTECPQIHCDLYEHSGGGLHLVNVLPGNASAAGEAVIGSGRLLTYTANGQGVKLSEAPNTSRAVSADGGVVFWSSGETGKVYARIDARKTYPVEGPESCRESVVEIAARACFLTASADGSEVLLSNGRAYARDDAAEGYEQTADLTEGQGGFEGILGAAANLSRVYFVDSAVLPGAAGQENANGEEAEAGAPNLYTWHEGALEFLGTLTARDNNWDNIGRYGSWRAAASDRTAQVTSDGRFLAFMSRAPLTGYDNSLAGGGECPELTGQACAEVFEYAAGTDTLACASCDPSGQRPLGPSNLTLLRQGQGPAALPFRQPANLSPEGEGRLFFESQDTLSSRDRNGRILDVYEWEPEGVGGCESSYAEGGCVALISSGQSRNDSMFMDSTPSGSDAFFITRSRLLARDENDQLDLYDARVHGGIAEEAEAQPCEGEACKGPAAAAPSQPGAASAAFAGPGNPAPKGRGCKKGKVLRRGRCVKKPHRHKHKKHKRKRHRRRHAKRRAVNVDRGGRR
jgi:hypothetical protein